MDQGESMQRGQETETEWGKKEVVMVVWTSTTEAVRGGIARLKGIGWECPQRKGQIATWARRRRRAVVMLLVR
jgi:hypothetical protein